MEIDIENRHALRALIDKHLGSGGSIVEEAITAIHVASRVMSGRPAKRKCRPLSPGYDLLRRLRHRRARPCGNPRSGGDCGFGRKRIITRSEERRVGKEGRYREVWCE